MEHRSADSDAPLDRVRPLIRVRQTREFTDEPVSRAELDAIADVARWTGSSTNEQPWRFIVLAERDTLHRIAEIGLPQTRPLITATAAVAIVLPDDPAYAISYAYDEGRAAERILVAASALDLGAGIAWIRTEVGAAVRELLNVPPDRRIRSLVAIGHPTAAGRRPKSGVGRARRPRAEMVFEERWPGE